MRSALLFIRRSSFRVHHFAFIYCFSSAGCATLPSKVTRVSVAHHSDIPTKGFRRDAFRVLPRGAGRSAEAVRGRHGRERSAPLALGGQQHARGAARGHLDRDSAQLRRFAPARRARARHRGRDQQPLRHGRRAVGLDCARGRARARLEGGTRRGGRSRRLLRVHGRALGARERRDSRGRQSLHGRRGLAARALACGRRGSERGARIRAGAPGGRAASDAHGRVRADVARGLE